MKLQRLFRYSGGALFAASLLLTSCNRQQAMEKEREAKEKARMGAEGTPGDGGGASGGPATKSDRKPENPPAPKMTTTDSGLQYEVLKEGTGPKPGPSDRVSVHYHGTLPDGTVFDSSVDRGRPTSFGVDQVIKGWTEGLQLMKVGSKYKFVIPPELAYGQRGAGGKIGPNATLIFEVELLGIE